MTTAHLFGLLTLTVLVTFELTGEVPNSIELEDDDSGFKTAVPVVATDNAAPPAIASWATPENVPAPVGENATVKLQVPSGATAAPAEHDPAETENAAGLTPPAVNAPSVSAIEPLFFTVTVTGAASWLVKSTGKELGEMT